MICKMMWIGIPIVSTSRIRDYPWMVLTGAASRSGIADEL